jgi:hypothetical protein
MTTIARNMGRLLSLRSLGALGLASATCAGAGCTLINSYDELAPEKVTPLLDGAPGVDSSVGPDATAGIDSGGGGGPDGGTHDGAAPDDGAAAVAAAHGVIVIGGEASGDAGSRQVLTALDPSTGTELPKARRSLNVAAVFYDGVREDLWYVFESGGHGIFPLPTDPFFLHTFKLDPITGQWTELGVFAIAPGVSFATTAVIKGRLSYIAYGDGEIDGGVPAEGGSPYSLVTLDTSDPTAVALVGSPVPLGPGSGGLVGTDTAVSAAGGFVTLGSTAKVDGGTVSVLTPLLVPGMGMPSPEAPIYGTSPSASVAGFGTATINGTPEALVVTRPNGPATLPATLSVFDPSASDPTMALLGAGMFPFTDGNVKAPAFSACDQMAFVVGTNADLSVHAVWIGGIGQANAGVYPPLPFTAAATGHSGQGVYFEPYTKTVLTPFSQGDNFALTAFTLAGTSQAPVLMQRQAPRWVPPPDLRPNFVATKVPYPDGCLTTGDN